VAPRGAGTDVIPGHPAPPASDTLPSLIRRLAARHEDLPQIEEAAGALSFREVERRSALLARGLLASGVGKGEKVGLLMGNGCDWVVAFWAVARIGAVAVLLSTFAKPAELAWLLRHGDTRTLIACHRHLRTDMTDRLRRALPGLETQPADEVLVLPAAPSLRAIWIAGGPPPPWAAGDLESLVRMASASRFDEEMLAAVEAEVTPADTALIIYTSGSTAEPKAVLHSHGGVTRQAEAMAGYMTFMPGDRLMTTQPFFWVGGLCTSLMAANIKGATFVCPDEPSPDGMLRTLRERNVTHVTLWPAQMAGLREAPGFSDEDFGRLRPVSAQQLGMFGVVDPVRTPNALGMSETFGPHSMEYPDSPLPPDRQGSFGRQVQQWERRIVDPETGRVVAPGEVGEIAVRGPDLMLGFHKRERAATFEPDGFYRTGDLGRMSEDGHLFFLGRLVETLKTGGANVSPREVELVLTAQPEIQDAAVVGLPDARLGDLVVAAVVLRPSAAVTEAVLIQRLHEHLSAYKVPKRIAFLAEEEVPRTDSAKIRKPELRALLARRLAAESSVARQPGSLT